MDGDGDTELGGRLAVDNYPTTDIPTLTGANSQRMGPSAEEREHGTLSDFWAELSFESSHE